MLNPTIQIREFHQTTFDAQRHQMLVGLVTLAIMDGQHCFHSVTTMLPISTASVMSGKQFILTSP
jgi:hypothetical protein